jgi:hypothetical protein
MIDYFMKYNAESEAIAAAEAAGKLGRRDAENIWRWDTDYVRPNIKTWRISQDSSTIVSDGIHEPTPVITHTSLPGWYAIVSTVNPNALLSNDPALAIELNRDGPPYLRKNNTGIAAVDLNFEPIFSGSHYPIGGITS